MMMHPRMFLQVARQKLCEYPFSLFLPDEDLLPHALIYPLVASV